MSYTIFAFLFFALAESVHVAKAVRQWREVTVTDHERKYGLYVVLFALKTYSSAGL